MSTRKLIALALLLALSQAEIRAAGCGPDAPQRVAVAKPTWLAVMAIYVGWADCRRETFYTVERADYVGGYWGPFTAIGAVGQNQTEFTDAMPLFATPMRYRVVAHNKCGVAVSAAVEITLP